MLKIAPVHEYVYADKIAQYVPVLVMFAVKKNSSKVIYAPFPFLPVALSQGWQR